MAGSSIGLTVFLLKADQSAAFETRFPASHPAAMPLRTPLQGYFIPLPSVGKAPIWVDAVNSLLHAPTSANLDTQSPGGLVAVQHQNRTFVLTFGHAWQKLEISWLERDFGRRVALNSIKADGLIELRAEQIFAKWHVSSDRAPRATSVDDFGIEFDRDLVASVEGVPSDQTLGKMLRGSTSLRLTLPIAAIAAVLKKSTELFASAAYRKRWPEIDNLRPVVDSQLLAKLEAQLDQDLGDAQKLKRIALLTPTHPRHEALIVDSYVIGNMSDPPVKRPYLTIDSWIAHLSAKHHTPSVSTARSTKVHRLDDNDDEIRRCSMFDCFGYELSLAGRTYVLSSSVWYEVVADFLTKINTQISALEQPSTLLPAWNGVDSEGQYNTACGARKGFLGFDEGMIHFGGGQSKFEFCDVLHPASRTMYFCKIVLKSSGMSHLVEQARRTSELCFATDSAFRQKLEKIFEKYHPTADRSWFDKRPPADDWNFCLVSLGRAASALPFFAKCGLVKLKRDLTERGHRVSFLKV
jgi:uncharacterized protein (TIGR04141 family)